MSYTPLQWAGLAVGLYIVYHVIQYAWFAIWLMIVFAIIFVVFDLIDR